MGLNVAKKLIQAHLIDGDMVPGQESGHKLSSLIVSSSHREFPCQFGRGVSIVFYRVTTFVTAQGLPLVQQPKQLGEGFETCVARTLLL
jgi:hypothetical protein